MKTKDKQFTNKSFQCVLMTNYIISIVIFDTLGSG